MASSAVAMGSSSFPVAATAIATSLILLSLLPTSFSEPLALSWMPSWRIPQSDCHLLQFPFNLEYFETELFLFAAFGRGLDSFNESLAFGGPPPFFPPRKANLSPKILDIVKDFAFQEVGHLRALVATVAHVKRPQLDVTTKVFSESMDKAVGFKSNPPFDGFKDDLSFLLLAFFVPYVGLNGYVGAFKDLEDSRSRRLVGGLLTSEAGQDAVIRTELYKRKDMKVPEYRSMTVGEITSKIAELRNTLANPGEILDEGIVVDKAMGAEGKTGGNALAGDKYSVAYSRTPEQILRILYGSGDEKTVGGHLPDGGVGCIAEYYYKENPNCSCG